MIINIYSELKKQDENITRYNGGWTKKVTGLNKEVTNGYSILGDFIKIAEDIVNNVESGLYLDCDIGGSRKYQERNYRLFRINPDGTITILQTIEDGGGDWAYRLWETIEKELSQPVSSELREKLLELISTYGSEKVEMEIRDIVGKKIIKENDL